MVFLTVVVVVIGLGVLIYLLLRMKRGWETQELERHSIEPEELHTLLAAKADVLVLDVRMPLDLLAHPETIPGARRVAPQDILDWIETIPRDRPTIVCCTCPSDESRLSVLRRALAFKFTQIRVLRGGLAEWKKRGFTVEPYDEAFHLDTSAH